MHVEPSANLFEIVYFAEKGTLKQVIQDNCLGRSINLSVSSVSAFPLMSCLVTQKAKQINRN